MKKIFQKAGVLSKKIFQRALDYVEVIGNKLPHPATLFALLAFLVVIISWIGSAMDAHIR